MGREVTLDDIEHEILRKQFGDPRIHFSIVCASMGCPVLSGVTYRGDMLENQLENDAWRFVNNEERVRLDREKNRIFVSSIFKWYKEDFETGDDSDWLRSYKKSTRGFLAFIVRYIDEERRHYIVNNIPKIEYLDYDWSLNELLDEP
jgi:hypothetical protein